MYLENKAGEVPLSPVTEQSVVFLRHVPVELLAR